MTKLITSDNTFSPQQRAIIQFMVAMMIPAEGELPGAADAGILPAIVAALAENPDFVLQVLDWIEETSRQKFGIEFAKLEASEKVAIVTLVRAQQAEFIKLFQVCVASSYYQDPRVMLNLGLEARPPHPGGYQVDATDWSLLEPVRSMEKIYRPA